MKKILSMLMACAMFTGVLVGCDTSNNENDESQSSNSSSIIGSWSNESLVTSGAAMSFKENGIFSLITDVSETMYFDGESFIVSGVSYEYEFDGENLSCIIDTEQLGLTEEENQPMIILDKIEKSDDINGKYLLTGGALYDVYMESLSSEILMYAIINDNEFYFEVDMCEYTYDDETITFIGDTAGLFNSDEEGDILLEYVISDGELTTIDTNGIEEVFVPFVIE